MRYPDVKPVEILPLLEEVIKALVEYPEAADVFETKKGNTLHYMIDVVPEDRGKIIGQGGSIIKGIKAVFFALGGKKGKRIVLEIKD
jgi:predicted RNA-binding protein YlqC (UPF0109 family)